jgi:beta-phosphoglucomutase
MKMKLKNEVKCVIFDMDGVIIDSEEIHKKAYYETFNSLNVTVSDALYKSFTGSSTINAFQRLVAHFNLDYNPEALVLDKRRRYVRTNQTYIWLKVLRSLYSTYIKKKLR